MNIKDKIKEINEKISQNDSGIMDFLGYVDGCNSSANRNVVFSYMKTYIEKELKIDIEMDFNEFFQRWSLGEDYDEIYND